MLKAATTSVFSFGSYGQHRELQVHSTQVLTWSYISYCIFSPDRKIKSILQEPRVLSGWCARGCRCDDNDSVSELTEADGLVCWRKAEEAEALWDLLAPSCFPSTPGTVPALWYSAMAELGMISRLISDCFQSWDSEKFKLLKYTKNSILVSHFPELITAKILSYFFLVYFKLNF